MSRPDTALRLRYRSLTGVRTVAIVRVMQLGRLRWPVLGNDARLAFAGTFFPDAGRAVEVVEDTLRKQYGDGSLLEWRLTDRSGERPIDRAELAAVLLTRR